MAADRFLFYISYYESLKELSSDDFQQIISAICEKAFYDKDPELKGHLRSLYKLIEPVLLKSVNISKARSEQGRKGGIAKSQKMANSSKRVANSKNDKQTLAEKEYEVEIEKGVNERGEVEVDDPEENTPTINTDFIPPTRAEVHKYCKDRHSIIDPDKFFDYYTSTGWTLSNGNPMKVWQAAIRNWERTEKEHRKNANTILTNDYSRSDFDDMEKRLLDN